MLFFLTACEQERKFQGDLSFYLPEDAQMVIRTSDPKELVNELENDNFLLGFGISKSLPGLSSSFKKFDTIDAKGETWLAITATADSITAFSYITEVPTPEANDTLATKTFIDQLRAKPEQTMTLITEKDTIYTALKESVLIAASSEELLENCINGQGIAQDEFFRLEKSLSANTTAAFVKEGLASALATGRNWTGLALEMNPDSFSYNGIAVDLDSTAIWRANNFGPPAELNANSVVPALGNLIERSFKRVDSLENSNEPQLIDLILDNSSGYGYYESEKAQAILFKAIDSLNFQEVLAPYSTALGSIQQIDRYSLTDSLSIKETLDEWVGLNGVSEFFRLNEHFVFTGSEEASQYIIDQFRANATMANDVFQKQISQKLSNTANLRLSGDLDDFLPYLSMGQLGLLGRELQPNKRQIYQQIVMQFTSEDGLIYSQMQTVPQIYTSTEQGIRQLISSKRIIRIDNIPRFFSNHRNRGKDLVEQTADFKLSLSSYSGNNFWSRDLGEPILGDIQEVDILRNGKKQLAFATASKLYVIDRNGDDVGPFPISFKDEVTQPLAIFDYDNNRKYRFVIVQGKEILMYDSKAKIVKGFTFTEAPSDLAMPPQHLRIGNKDYLTFALEDGSLLIKSRVGKDRIKVDQQFEFGASKIYQEQGNFVFLSGDQTKVTIDSRGGVTKKDLGVTEGFSLVIMGKTKVSLDENLLRINGRLYELPFGVYSVPGIYQVAGKRYVTVTDLQEKQVYVFDTRGDLIPNFPIYGTGPAQIADVNNNRKPNLMVRTGEQSYAIFEF